MKRSKNAPRLKQQTPQELLDELLAFLERKFYAGHPLNFAKDRPRLLDWVVLWPATWFDSRGVTVPTDRYREIFTSVFMDAAAFQKASKITYLPAYLRQVIQSHFSHHGESYYEAAKSMRNLVEATLLATGRCAAKTEPDPVRELAHAHRLLVTSRRAKKSAPPARQLGLF
jgi:hypothetical protein